MRFTSIVLPVLVLTGCAVGPDYHRPSVPVPPQYRGASASPGTSIAETKWAALFNDDTLTHTLDAALKNNFDLRIAAERVTQARAELGITRANLFPFLDAQAQFDGTRSSSIGSSTFIPAGTRFAASYTQAGVSLSWEADVWGRYRRLTEAARAEYFATEQGRRAAIVSLVAEVMSTYFQLLEQDLELEIGRNTRNAANDNLRLVNLRHDRGAATGLEVRQAEQFLYTATAQIAGAERAIGQTENALALLQGATPSDQPRGRKFEQFAAPPQLPPGLPSNLLERRPDVLQAEQNLVAANAQIGAARALYFPDISLTSFAGGQSRYLLALATAPARVYTVAPTALLPIFHAGQIRSQVRLSEAQQREMLIAYQRTIYTALREVSDSLIAHDRTYQQREQEELLVKALEDSVRLSTLRYKGGLDSYLQVLDAERNLFQGQLALAQLRLQELLSVVQLYRALGGGWT